MTNVLDPPRALIFVMVTIACVEGSFGETETETISRIVKTLPVFQPIVADRLSSASRQCMEILKEDEGLETVLGLVKAALPVRLCETAYAVAVEVAAADFSVHREEIRFLAMLRDTLGLDKLTTAAIERSAIARYQKP